MRLKLGLWLIILLLIGPFTVSAQNNVNIEWNRWDAQIAVPATSANSNQLQISETQEVHILNGAVRQGTRFWTSPVQVQAVYVVAGNTQSPTALQVNNGGQPGTYNVAQSSDRTTLTYYLPDSLQAGSTFTVQINYNATSPTNGMVDWKVVPAEHAFNVRSSTVQIRFPDGTAPDSSLVRVSNGQGKATINGNTVVIQSSGAIPAQQPFTIQVPFGAGVGAAGGNTSSNQDPNFNPNAPNGNNNSANSGNLDPQGNPTDAGTGFQLPGMGTILLIICVVGFLLLVGGGGLLRMLLGGFLGGASRGGGLLGGSGGLGGNSGGSFLGGNSSVQGPSNVDRGFRSSANQNRDVGSVGNDKDSGGGASFG